jgi:hypothetical protein
VDDCLVRRIAEVHMVKDHAADCDHRLLYMRV